MFNLSIKIDDALIPLSSPADRNAFSYWGDVFATSSDLLTSPLHWIFSIIMILWQLISTKNSFSPGVMVKPSWTFNLCRATLRLDFRSQLDQHSSSQIQKKTFLRVINPITCLLQFNLWPVGEDLYIPISLKDTHYLFVWIKYPCSPRAGHDVLWNH